MYEFKMKIFIYLIFNYLKIIQLKKRGNKSEKRGITLFKVQVNTLFRFN